MALALNKLQLYVKADVEVIPLSSSAADMLSTKPSQSSSVQRSRDSKSTDSDASAHDKGAKVSQSSSRPFSNDLDSWITIVDD